MIREQMCRSPIIPIASQMLQLLQKQYFFAWQQLLKNEHAGGQALSDDIKTSFKKQHCENIMQLHRVSLLLLCTVRYSAVQEVDESLWHIIPGMRIYSTIRETKKVSLSRSFQTCINKYEDKHFGYFVKSTVSRFLLPCFRGCYDDVLVQ